MCKLILRLLAASLIFFSSIVVAGHGEAAEESKEETVHKPEVSYIRMKPSFVANYGGSGRLRYLKVDISLRLKDDSNEELIMLHMAPLRYIVVSILSDQTEESVMTSAGKDALRKQALMEINEFFKGETNQENLVEDLLFNTFIVQQ